MQLREALDTLHRRPEPSSPQFFSAWRMRYHRSPACRPRVPVHRILEHHSEHAMIVNAFCNIRHVLKGDLESLTALLNNLDLRGDYVPGNLIAPREIEKQYLSDNAAPGVDEKFSIVDKEDRICGRIGYFKSISYFDSLELGYHIFSPDDQGKGFATRAVQLLVDYIFRTRNINRIEIRLNAANRASERVAVKCNFRNEGIARGAVFMNGSFVDITTYALLRSEWANAR
jgi:ribosomal-protein-alanine N-acetyltransferase